jgi:predicted DNA-binding transcriptional regulator AlpA
MIDKRRPEAAIDLRTNGTARLSSVHTLPAIHTTATRRLEHRHPERYVARAELAHIMGVSVATVDRMVAQGMPSVTWGRRTRRFIPSAAIDWATQKGSA